MDGVGNWSSNTHTTDGVTGTETRTASNVNEIASVTGDPYADGIAGQFKWDNNGNLLDDGLRTYQWDGLGRLHKVFRKSDGQQIAEYSYDAGNRRVRKEVMHGGLNGDVKNAITDFYYDGWRVLEEHDKKDDERQQYVYGNGLTEVWTLDKINPATTLERLNDGKGQQRQFYYCDSLGSIYGQADESGSLLVGFQYDTFGRAMAFLPDADGVVHFGQNGVFGGQTVVHGNSFLYIGSRYDAETDLSCLDERYYSAIQGRFISRDPIGFAGGVSLYAYVGNNPANRVDPMGLDPQDDAEMQLRFQKVRDALVGPTIQTTPPNPGAIERVVGEVSGSYFKAAEGKVRSFQEMNEMKARQIKENPWQIALDFWAPYQIYTIGKSTAQSGVSIYENAEYMSWAVRNDTAWMAGQFAFEAHFALGRLCSLRQWGRRCRRAGGQLQRRQHRLTSRLEGCLCRHIMVALALGGGETPKTHSRVNLAAQEPARGCQAKEERFLGRILLHCQVRISFPCAG